MTGLRGLVLLALLPLAACVTTHPPTTRPSTPSAANRPASTPPVAHRTPATTVPAQPPRPATRSGGRPRVSILEPDLKDGPPDPDEIPPGIEFTPDAVPRREPRSASGNPPEYEAFGEVYRVLDSSEGFREQGRASWYGRKFQGKQTSSGEPYDMFAMTAAHKTLPIPSYVRVKNLDNGRAVIVRVNDRGPFHAERVIDLSYAAAVRLDAIGHGHVRVQVEAVEPVGDAPVFATAPRPVPVGPPTPDPRQRWLQVAAYSDPANAQAMRDSLARRGMRDVDIRTAPGGALHRVVVGPFTNDTEITRTRARLNDAGYPAFPLRD